MGAQLPPSAFNHALFQTLHICHVQDPLCPDVGRRVRRLLLEAGATSHPVAVVQRLLVPGALHCCR